MHARTLIWLTLWILGSGFDVAAEFGDRVGALPAQIDEMQAGLTLDRTCEPDWAEQFAGGGAWRWDVDAYTAVWVVPCSNRDVFNPARRIYFEYAEDPKFYARADLPVIDLDRKTVARNEVYDFSWDQGALELTSIYRLQGRPDCGSRMVYALNAVKQRFVLTRVYMKPKCDGRLDPWPEIPVGPP